MNSNLSLKLTSILNDQLNPKTQFFGFADLANPLSMDSYQKWLDLDFHGDMQYLKDHLELKKQPTKIHSSLKSAILITQSYLPHPKAYANDFKLKNLRIASYAKGEDYHHWFLKNLKDIAQKLQSEFKDDIFLAYTDSGPILERDLIRKSGVTWIGKNTCSIHPKKGSFFFIGEILTSLDLKPQDPLMHDFCGTCTKCIDICPTKALEPRRLNANLCISYLNIESKQIPPLNLRPLMGDHFFGCDLCQSVCPWNLKWNLETKNLSREKISNSNLNSTPDTQIKETSSELKWILKSSNREIEKALQTSALLRAGPKKLKRNAIIVATNLGLTELIPEIQSYSDKEYFAELCQWSLDLLRF